MTAAEAQLVGFNADGKPRVRYRAVASTYAAASLDRAMRAWEYVLGDADEDLKDLEDLRGKSYDLCRNNPLALGAINTWVTHTIGTGLELQSRVDRRSLGLDDDVADRWEEDVEMRFRMWAEDHMECDIERTKNFYDIQQLMYRSELVAGDSLALMPFVRRRNSPFEMRVQVIDPARLRNENDLPDQQRLSGGVERDSVGAPFLYHVMQGHPHTSKLDGRTFTWRKIPAFGRVSGRQNVTHLKVETRAMQSRGVPLLAPIMKPLKQTSRLSESEIMASVINSFFTMIIRNSDGDEFDHGDEETAEGAAYIDKESEVALGSGNVLELGEGQDVTFADPKRPNQAFDAFMTSMYRQMSAGIGLPMEVWLKHFSSSYSASRGAMLELSKGVMMSRRHVGLQFCQPVYLNWLAEEVASGRVDAPGFFNDPMTRKAWCRHAWIGPPRGQVDPTKETQAERDQFEMTVKPLSDITTQLTGGDWNTSVERIARERRKMESLGISISAAPPSMPAPEPDDDEA